MSTTPQVPFTREPYPDGEEGIQLSLTKICERVRETAPTPIFRSFAGNILRQARFPRSNKEKATVFFEHMKKSVGYTHDPPGTELIQSPMVTLCVEGAPICIPIEDCDGFVAALASLNAAAGLEVDIVRQIFGTGQQQHVICEVKLENGEWFPLDATTPRFNAGEKAKATRETRMNPWRGEGSAGLQAEFVGIGAIPVFGLGEDGRYHELPTEMILGADEPQRVWYESGQGVQSAHPLVKPIRGLAEGLEGLGELIPEIPKLSTKAALIAGGAIIAGCVGIAAVIRKART